MGVLREIVQSITNQLALWWRCLPIIAFVEKLGAQPRRIASLYLGRWEGDRLVYAGKAQTGYTLGAAREVRERLDPLIRQELPLPPDQETKGDLDRTPHPG